MQYTPSLTLAQYLFDEGRIVELNNQAKHSVANNMSPERPHCHRVHLIFDYVDEHPIKQRFQLRPGELVYQTRRSIDLAREGSAGAGAAASSGEGAGACAGAHLGRRKSPGFVIIGAQVTNAMQTSPFLMARIDIKLTLHLITLVA